MSVTITLTVPASEFVFEQLLSKEPETTVQFERIVSLDEILSPFVWVSGGEPYTIQQCLESEPEVHDLEVLSAATDDTLFRIDWTPEIDGLLESLIETNGSILEAIGQRSEWRLVLLFSKRDQASVFLRRVTEQGVNLTVESIHSPTISPRGVAESTLTDAQREALVAAYQLGYFKIPRETTLRELADELGISDTALSQRLRRGVEHFVGDSVPELKSQR